MSIIHRKVLIIGSGPAGLTAGIYTSRAQLQPLLVEGEPSSTSDQPGGQLMLTTEVENFPGFPNQVQGPELMLAMREQAKHFGTEIITAKITRVDLSGPPHRLWVGDPDAPEPTYTADAVIVSTGAQALMLGIDAEWDLMGRGVSTCATCDGFFFRGRDVAVVGGGDSAMEEALFLARMAGSVTVIHRRDELRASKIMAERAMEHPKIKFMWNTVVEDLVGDETLEAVKLRDLTTDAVSTVPMAGFFVAIGHRPNTDLFLGQLATDDDGYIETVADGTRTSVEGVFACGDVPDETYRQAITAAGSGCMAAIDAERWLETRGG